MYERANWLSKDINANIFIYITYPNKTLIFFMAPFHNRRSTKEELSNLSYQTDPQLPSRTSSYHEITGMQPYYRNRTRLPTR